MNSTETQSRRSVQRLIWPGLVLWLTVISFLLLRVLHRNGERLNVLESRLKAVEYRNVSLANLEAQVAGFTAVIGRSEEILNRIEREMQNRGWKVTTVQTNQ